MRLLFQENAQNNFVCKICSVINVLPKLLEVGYVPPSRYVKGVCILRTVLLIPVQVLFNHYYSCPGILRATSMADVLLVLLHRQVIGYIYIVS